MGGSSLRYGRTLPASLPKKAPLHPRLPVRWKIEWQDNGLVQEEEHAAFLLSSFLPFQEAFLILHTQILRYILRLLHFTSYFTT
jgi:hypothetical protein